MTDALALTPDVLLQELRQLIEAARGRAARTINTELVLLYWQVGRRLREEVLGEDRGAYGKQVVEVIAQSLSSEFWARLRCAESVRAHRDR